jgi:WD40 repeat protein
LLDSPNRVTALAVDSSDSRSRRLVAAATRNSITIYGGDGLQYLPIPAPIKELTFANQGLVAVTETGEVIEFILTELNSRSAGSGCCENGIQEAALHPSGDEVLLVCHPSCEHPWERVSLEKNDAELIPGSSVESLGLSWSPNGDQYITAASNGGLLLWSASYNQPLAEFNPPGKTLETHWTADGSALVSRNSAGEVYWWNLEMIQIKKGLH